MYILRFLAILACTLSLASIAPFSAEPLGAEQLDSDPDTRSWVITSGAFTGLPPGSLTAVAVALERGIDALKLDLVLSSDDQVMVLPSPLLDDTTNVARLYPGRERDDGSYYSVDFTGAELKRLTLNRTTVLSADTARPPDVFSPNFPVISLAEALGYIDLVTTDATTAPLIIGELREGWLHRRDGKNLAAAAYELLRTYRSGTGKASAYLASYDPDELQELAQSVAREHSDIRLIQIIGANDGSEVKSLQFGRYQPYNFDLMFTRFGLKATADYAAAIGLTPEVLFDETGTMIRTGYLTDAQTLGIRLIAYGEAAEIPLKSLDEVSPATRFEQLFTALGFNGVLSDDIDLLEKWRQKREKTAESGTENTVDRIIKQLENGSPLPGSADQSRNQDPAFE